MEAKANGAAFQPASDFRDSLSGCWRRRWKMRNGWRLASTRQARQSEGRSGGLSVLGVISHTSQSVATPVKCARDGRAAWTTAWCTLSKVWDPQPLAISSARAIQSVQRRDLQQHLASSATLRKVWQPRAKCVRDQGCWPGRPGLVHTLRSVGNGAGLVCKWHGSKSKWSGVSAGQRLSTRLR
jgi:hypothetical protein